MRTYGSYISVATLFVHISGLGPGRRIFDMACSIPYLSPPRLNLPIHTSPLSLPSWCPTAFPPLGCKHNTYTCRYCSLCWHWQEGFGLLTVLHQAHCCSVLCGISTPLVQRVKRMLYKSSSPCYPSILPLLPPLVHSTKNRVCPVET